MFSFRRTKETMQSNMTGRYRYYKGNEYTILGVACHSEALEEIVAYRAEYGECDLWECFFETTEIDGKKMQRFERM